MSAPRVLIVGTGSVGRRHARNLHALGAVVDCFDPRQDRLDQASAELPVRASFTSFDAALEQAAGYDGVVIASPPVFHVDQSMAWLDRGVAVLLEKPVSPDLASALRLEEAVASAAAPLLLGYTYRWWPPLLELRRRLASGVIGPVRHARFTMSAHLADWHPWEAYQDFFMASRELGGGALLDESHFLDLMLWLFGRPAALAGRVEHLSSLDISTDDNVDLLVEYPDALRVAIHLDLFGRPHEKSVTIVGEDGTLQCGFGPDVVRHSADAAGNWDVVTFDCERNHMFVETAREFLDVAARVRPPSCTASDGVDVLRLVEMARRSTDERRTVALAEFEAV
jgi:predicted dehydrogenase